MKLSKCDRLKTSDALKTMCNVRCVTFGGSGSCMKDWWCMSNCVFFWVQLFTRFVLLNQMSRFVSILIPGNVTVINTSLFSFMLIQMTVSI